MDCFGLRPRNDGGREWLAMTGGVVARNDAF